MHMAQVIFFGILQCLFHFITIIICAHTFESTWKKSLFFPFLSLLSLGRSLCTLFLSDCVIRCFALTISHLFTRALCHCCSATAIDADGLRKTNTQTRASTMQSSKVFELAAYSMFFPCLYSI